MDLSQMMPGSVLGYVQLGLGLIGAGSALAAALARLTKTDKDDKVVRALVWMHDKAALVGLHPKLDVKRVGGQLVDAAIAAGRPVRDHRSK